MKLFAAEQKAKGSEDAAISRHETLDSEHGRIETRRYTAFHDIDWPKETDAWAQLEGVVMGFRCVSGDGAIW